MFLIPLQSNFCGLQISVIFYFGQCSQVVSRSKKDDIYACSVLLLCRISMSVITCRSEQPNHPKKKRDLYLTPTPCGLKKQPTRTSWQGQQSNKRRRIGIQPFFACHFSLLHVPWATCKRMGSRRLYLPLDM